MWFLRNVFGRKKGRRSHKQAIPDWADFFEADEYILFIDSLQQYFEMRDKAVVFGDGVVEVDGQSYGLTNLAQLCHQEEDRNEWPVLVEHHFGLLGNIHDEREQLEDVMSDYEAVAPMLAIRFWANESLQEVGEDSVVYREDLPGVSTVLVLDLPSSIQQVHPSEAVKWGRTDAELFERALQNVQRITDHEVSPIDMGDGLEVQLICGDSFFVATLALMLGEMPGCMGAHGSIFGIPHRHVVVAYPVNDVGVIGALNKMLPVIYGMNKEGPGSITPNLYWYHDGRYIHLPCEMTSSKLTFSPPDEFVEVLNLLSPDDGDDDGDSG